MAVSVPAHRGTTAHLQAAYPFVAEGGLGGEGVYIGRDLFGGAFCFDPFVLYARGILTNPNLLIIGQVGKGKSSLVKTMMWRQMVFGPQSLVVEVKGEYQGLAAAVGVTPIRIGPGSPIRLNPLDAGPASSQDGEEVLRRRVGLLASLGASALRRPLTPDEQSAVELAVRAVTANCSTPTLPQVVEALLWPDAEAARTLATTASELAVASRSVALELRRLCHGDLAGMFDAPTTAGLRLDTPLVVLDLSALQGSEALRLLMVCATAWLQAVLVTTTGGKKRILVVDEAWRILRDVQVAGWLQSTFKLSRHFGLCNVAVLHRLSDLRAAGSAGSEQERLAEGLLADTETQVIYSQPAAEVDRCRDLLGLSDAEAAILPQLTRGVALWRVAGRSFLVEHRLSRTERLLVNTDERMS